MSQIDPFRMMMSKNRNPLISTFSSQLTATISVALVLLVLGVVALLSIAARTVTREIRENLGFDIVMAEGATDSDINRVKQLVAKAPYTASYEFISASQALDQWQEDTGENLRELIDVNPFCPEFDVKVREDYANADSISAIKTRLQADKSIEEIVAHTEMVNDINRNINTISLVLTIIAGALLIISFVLINNTVRLTVYARRFTIHTMKLVGASRGFIRRPFIINGLAHGIIAGLIAAALLAGLIYYAHTLDASVRGAVGWCEAGVVLGSTVVAGILICVIASLLATNRYLRLDYDEMFR